MSGQPAQTPLEDLRRDALDHYDKAADAISCHSSAVPRAIKEYYAKRIKVLLRADFWIRKGDKQKTKTLIKQAKSMVFQADESSCLIDYGHCEKLDKPVSFIPGTIQLETQGCFEQRHA